MRFEEILNEIKLKTVDSETENGNTPGAMLIRLFDEFGNTEWEVKQDKKIRRSFKEKDDRTLKATLVRLGMIEKVGKKFKITPEGHDWLDKNSDSDTLAKGTKDISKLRAKKFKVPTVGKNSKYLDQMKKILSHMKSFSNGTTKTTYMLAGDVGSGKTSFTKSLSTLTGVPLVIIEAPHITQEHLINIPFLVLDGNKEYKGNVNIDDSEGNMKIIQAESNLVTRLKRKKLKSPEQIQKYINKDKVLRDIQPMLENRLKKIEGKYTSILFLDEFYRSSSVKIRNVLRNILNGKIGNDKINKGVYIIMATNIDDEGIEDIPLNQDFHLIDYDVSSKEDFMSFMYGKYINPDDLPEEEAESASSISIPVWNKFMDTLSDADLGYNDPDTDVRLSPRRLEQIIICVNSLLPVKDQEGALQLFAFMKNNLSNYLEQKPSQNLLNKFDDIISELISETSPELNLDLDYIQKNPLGKSKWRSQLQTEIELKLSLGEDRAYVPVVSGNPGIGKTTLMKTTAKNLEMGYIHIDVSNLTPEDVTGIPIADRSQGDENITVEFSEPNLYLTIMREYNEIIERYTQENRKYNIILLFDEMNRSTVPVFNSIRKVLLEKEFEQVKLPKDILITGAINPNDIGAIEFTSHTRDVLDIIPSSGDYQETVNYILAKKELKEINENIGFDLRDSLLSIMNLLVTEFKSEFNKDGIEVFDRQVQPFWWNSGTDVFYVSPREITECISNAASQIEDGLEDVEWDTDANYKEKEYDKFIQECLNITAKSFFDSFNMITLKQEIIGFSQDLANKIQKNDKFKKCFESMKTRKSRNAISLLEIMKNSDDDISYLDASVIGPYISDFSNTEMIQDISNVIDYFTTKYSNPSEAIPNIISLYKNIRQSLQEVKASNSYEDQLKKYTFKKINSILVDPRTDLTEFLKNDKLQDEINTLFN